MKRIISIVLTCILLLSSVQLVSFAANGNSTGNEPCIIMSSKTANPGDSVEISVEIVNNPGIALISFALDYDKSAITSITKSANGKLFEDINYASKCLMENDTNVTDDGLLVKFTVELADDVDLGDYSIGMLGFKCYNYDEEKVNVTLESCVITVVCPHTNKTQVPAKAPTCLENGNEEYYICNYFDCDAIFDSKGVETTLEAVTVAKLGHSFTDYKSDGNATCLEDGTKTAKCDRCDVTETITDKDSALGHSFTNYVSNDDATCTADGTKTAQCDRCDVTDTKSDEGSKKPHSYSTEWSKDENGHWHDCVDCSDRTETIAHDFGDIGDTCLVCEYERDHVHRLTLVNAVEATCTEDGNIDHYTCSGCDKLFGDVTGLVEIDSVVIPATGHSFAAATCTTPKTCSVCNATEGKALGHSFTNYVSDDNATCTVDGTKTATCDRCDVTDTIADEGSAKGHNYSTEWSKDGKEHWHNCTNCNDKQDVAAHDYGSAGDICEVCGYERDHVHRLTLVNAIEATCTTGGNKAYYTCSGCDELFEDAMGSVVIEDRNSVVIAALGHKFAAATCTTPKTCTVCNVTEGEALGHKFADATCTAPKTCTVCNATEGEALGHKFAAATCTAPKTCTVCNATEGEALGHSFTNYVSNNDATCIADGTKTAKCDRCDATDKKPDTGTKKPHNYSKEWSKDGKEHWHNCTNCNDKQDVAAHNFGDKGDTCLVCDYVREHVHRLTLVPEIKVTCTTDGRKAYYTCSGCDKWLADATGSVVIEDHNSVIIAATGHDYADATYEKPRTCKNCGDEKGKPLMRPVVIETPEDLEITTPENSEITSTEAKKVVDTVVSYIGSVEQPKDTGVAANSAVIDAAKQNIKDENNQAIVTDNYQTALSVVADNVVVATEGDNLVVLKITYDVTPYLYALSDDDDVLGKTKLNNFDSEITFRLPVDKNTTADTAKVLHEDEELGTYPIITDENGNKYVEVKSKTFSAYTVELHYHEYESAVTPPDCTEKGYTTHTCKTCGNSYKDNYVDAKGHDYTEATATAPKTCKICGHTEGDVLKQDYKVIEGGAGIWILGSNKELTFRADGDFNLFTGVMIDGTLIDSSNYSVASGSTVVTLKTEYLKTLNKGEHELTIVFKNGSAKTNFEIKSQSEASPLTGEENSAIVLMGCLFLLSGIALISVLIIKKKHSKVK